MIDDIRAVNELARKEFPGKPLALFGHSMGSMAVRSFTKRHDDAIDALVVCGSPSYNSVASLYLWAVAGGAIEGMKDYAPKKQAPKKRQK